LKAHEYIGLNINQLNSEKQEFLKTIVPKWIEEGKEREKKYPVQTVN
jgi:nitrite reductase (cytochrome c-552)